MLKTILTIFIMSVSAHAITESQIQQVMDKKVHQVLNILKNNSLSQTQKEAQSIKVIDSVFDYATMAQISLGKKWKSLSKNEKNQFSNAFEKKIKLSYLDKLRLYNNQTVNIEKFKKIKSNRITLETQVIGKNETYKVVYLFYKNKKNSQWYIYDVELVGVSIIQTYRKQFSEFLKTKSVTQLINSL